MQPGPFPVHPTIPYDPQGNPVLRTPSLDLCLEEHTVPHNPHGQAQPEAPHLGTCALRSNRHPATRRGKPNLARFVYNYLGNLTARPLPDPDNATMAPPGSNPAEGMPCDTTVNVCPEPLVCVGWRYGTKDASGMGRCRNTTTLYVPAYSTRWGRGVDGDWTGVLVVDIRAAERVGARRGAVLGPAQYVAVWLQA